MAILSWLALPVMQDAPAFKERTQLARVGARGRAPRLIGIGDMHDHDQQCARPKRRLHARNQTALEIITGQHEIVGVRLEFKFAGFQIDHVRVDGRITSGRAIVRWRLANRPQR